jgi:hypothetical protein
VGKSYARVLMMDQGEFEKAILAGRALLDQLAKQEQGEPVANASTWFALVMNAAAELENASIFLRDEDAKRVAISGAKYYRDEANTLYTTPQQRTWVGLTDDELNMLGDKMKTWNSTSLKDIYIAIESKLKERNT